MPHVTDRVQGLDCWMCEEGEPHTHGPLDPQNIKPSLTLKESQGLRMAVRWGAPDPLPPELGSAVSKLAAAEIAAESDE